MDRQDSRFAAVTGWLKPWNQQMIWRALDQQKNFPLGKILGPISPH
jgi:hypothetical protein